MGVVVDTNVWSLFVRRTVVEPAHRSLLLELRHLVARDDAILIGPVRQEVLTSIRAREQFERVRRRMRGFLDEPLIVDDFERAAAMATACGAVGVQGGPTDMLICAVSERLGAPIYTLDTDFERYAEVLGVGLHKP